MLGAMRWACALMLSGCSFAFMNKPTSGPIDRDVDCRSALPSIDVVGALLAGGLGALTYAASLQPPAPTDFLDLDPEVRGVAIALLGVSALATASAVYGFYETHACRRHVDDEVASMHAEARVAARSGRCDEVVEVGGRLERAGRELDLDDPETRACFPFFCATADSGFCACSQERSDCEAAVGAGLARSCVPARVDVCVAVGVITPTASTDSSTTKLVK